jgi:hypothetical protein
MSPITYRCPTTGKNVQGWFADEASTNDGEVYEAVTCLAWSQVHLINRVTGRALGGDDE